MNKKSKKRIIGLALVLALFAIIASGTLAYFTDETEVATNAFTVGKVQIRLSETLVDANGAAKDTDIFDANGKYEGYTGTDDDGDIWTTAGELNNENRTDVGNNAKNEKATKVKGYDGNDYGYALMPGKTVDKDPVVTVLMGSEESFVRAQVTLDHAKKFLKVFKDHIEAGDITYTGGTTTNDIAAAIDCMKGFFVDYSADIWEAVNAEYDSTEDKLTVTFNYIGTEYEETYQSFPERLRAPSPRTPKATPTSSPSSPPLPCPSG